MSNQAKLLLTLVGLLILGQSGCAQKTNNPVITDTPAPSPTLSLITTATFTPTVIDSPSPTLITPSVTATITPTTAADGCQRPPDNYERISINGRVLNLRTYEMLEYAGGLYGGVIDITGQAITQGSYTSSVEASFGTHSGGGAVDLSVMYPGTYTIHEDDIEPLIRALRLAGFAAWYRDFDELYDGSPVHIHAIAIGDQELSFAARQQLTGPHGYFYGFNGLPVESGTPAPDPHGGPIICGWMVELGYPNKTATPTP